MPAWVFILVICCLFLLPSGATTHVSNEDASLLAEEPEPLRCFSKQYEDLTCFWDEVEEEEEEKEEDCVEEKEESGEEDPGPYKLFFAYPGEEPQRCPLSCQRLPEGGLRHVCQVQPADGGVRLFAKLTLWVWDPAKDRNRTQRVLSLENVGLPAPPKNITAMTSGQTGELQVTWEVQPSEISDFMQHELQYGPLDPSNSAQPTVTALLQAPMCCPFMRWPHTQPHQATATPKPDLTPAQLPGTQSIQQYPTIEGPSRKGYMSQGPAIRGHTVPQRNGPGQLGATRESQELIGGSCIISGFQPGISYWLQLRSKPDGISLKGFWGPWSSPVTVTLPQDAREIGLQCFTQDLEHITCQWQGPAHPTASHGYFYHWRPSSCPKNRGPDWEKCEKMDSRAEETPISHCHFESRNDSAIHILVEITTELGTIQQYLATPFWMHQIVLIEAPELQWTVGFNGQLKLTWRPPLPWLPGQTHYQLRYSGQKLGHWKVLEPPRGALGETLELRPGAQYRLQLRARPDGPTYHGPWSAWSAPALVEVAPESGWVSVVTSVVLTLGFGGLVGLVLRRLFPARFRSSTMAQFVFENDLHSLLQLDTSIVNAPPARWQRKAKETPGPPPSPMRTANRSHSSGRTPGRTPGKSGSKTQSTPSKAGGDRYIPHRSASQMEVASFLLSKENQPANHTPTRKEQQKAWSLNLNGFDVEEAKILRLSGKPQNAPEGYQNSLRVLYSQKATPGSSRKKTCRYIPSLPDRILDAPEIRNDYYLNLMDWSCGNVLAVALDTSVYLWSAGSGEILQLLQTERPGDYVSSVAWIKEGNYLAVGTSSAEVQLWDVQQQKRLRNMSSHTARVGALAWNSYILSSGSRSGHVHHHDVRVAEHHVATLSGHSQEVCGLRWAPDGRYLASGGNDNLVNVWPSAPSDGGWGPLQTFTQHVGAVKAVAWCPWQSNVLATGGGTSDRHIRIWNVCSGACLSAVDAQSQVCAILWSPHYKELISGHGFAQNQLVIWKYPSMAKVAELKGHTARVLSLTMSPDGCTVASAAADETLRLWRCFELDPARRREREKASAAKSSLIHQGIR
ncbi:thrombopoietin receptor isoform X2 [Phascolarctos cinereus]|uniref:Cell division cycle protein 20 homolog n=1 Tax=Phascolarctos cinereus TaxID=38626 RepID=A0A6P5JIV5_PHACI|nr:cell division cycle protein 20 homolog isoform X2 [Phascolarctos cinereus]